jgi:hypothetical protein
MRVPCPRSHNSIWVRSGRHSQCWLASCRRPLWSIAKGTPVGDSRHPSRSATKMASVSAPQGPRMETSYTASIAAAEPGVTQMRSRGSFR